MDTSEERVKVIDLPNRKTIKIWCERTQKYYYKPKDPQYFVRYFHKTKKPMTCEHCGRTVMCQFYNHLKSEHCRAKRREAERELEIEQLREELAKLKISD